MANIEIKVTLTAIDITKEAFKEAVLVAEKNDWYVVVKFTKVKFDFGEETLFVLSPRHDFCHVTVGGASSSTNSRRPIRFPRRILCTRSVSVCSFSRRLIASSKSKKRVDTFVSALLTARYQLFHVFVCGPPKSKPQSQTLKRSEVMFRGGVDNASA